MWIGSIIQVYHIILLFSSLGVKTKNLCNLDRRKTSRWTQEKAQFASHFDSQTDYIICRFLGIKSDATCAQISTDLWKQWKLKIKIKTMCVSISTYKILNKWYIPMNFNLQPPRKTLTLSEQEILSLELSSNTKNRGQRYWRPFLPCCGFDLYRCICWSEYAYINHEN